MIDKESPTDLSGWYSELASVWLGFARTCRYHMGQSLSWQRTQAAREWMEMAHKASLRAGRYARLADENRTYVEYQQDMALLENITPDDLEDAITQVHDNTRPQKEVIQE